MYGVGGGCGRFVVHVVNKLLDVAPAFKQRLKVIISGAIVAKNYSLKDQYLLLRKRLSGKICFQFLVVPSLSNAFIQKLLQRSLSSH